MSKLRILNLIFTFTLSVVLLSACKKDKDAEPATPTITSLSVTSGCDGLTITITGTNFSTTAANNVVKFGTATATVQTATATQLTVTVPAAVNESSNTVSVTVSTNSKISTGINFTYNCA